MLFQLAMTANILSHLTQAELAVEYQRQQGEMGDQ